MASVALWRWLETLSTEHVPDRQEVMRLTEAASKLVKTRLIRRMFFNPILGSLPQIEENILRRLALLTWAVGSKNDARLLFSKYIALASSADLGPVEKRLMDEVLASGLITSEHLNLMRSRRLRSLRRYNNALALLAEAPRSGDPAVRAEERLLLAHLQRIQGLPRSEITTVLGRVIEDAADSLITQTALFERAMVSNREGSKRDIEQFKNDLSQLIENYPRGRYTDDALYELARYFQSTGDIKQALSYFERARKFEGPNDWFDLSHLQPAMALYARNGPGDIDKARSLLHVLKLRRPSGPLYLNALFWLGRIAAETGDKNRSEIIFEQIISKAPYDYYAIRARMHLHLGCRASR
ncbi:MAG: tetratricopeptide repeat protein, partial [Candidatus Krumholzibacteria bacterium]|nr:tetratricopeptide repeat protein [Candidatus Krumholzibacteria bacterium]